MTDLARHIGVSKNTISLALRHDPQIPEKTRARVQGLAVKMGYTKNPNVAALMGNCVGPEAPAFNPCWHS